MQSTPASERFNILDVLRGFALLGVLLANMATHSGYFFLSDTQQQLLSTAEADSVIVWILHFLVEGKFYSLFSLLFGIGFALQMKRSDELKINFASRYRRRLLIQPVPFWTYGGAVAFSNLLEMAADEQSNITQST